MGDCPGCGHPLDRETHDRDTGCQHGWQWDHNGIATVDGCECPLTVARYC